MNKCYYTGESYVTPNISKAFMFKEKEKAFEFAILNRFDFPGKYYKIKEIEITDNGEVFNE